jgi:LemA protein
MNATVVVVLLVLGGLVLVVVGAVVAFNKVRRLDVHADEALAGVDVQLTRRADLIPNVVATVTGYAGHEQAVLENVTAARAAVSTAARTGTVPDRAAAEAGLDRALVDVLAVAEAYPDLKASTQFLDLQRQLSDTEGQLAFARQYYNDAVRQLNTTVRTVPWMWFAPMAGVDERDFYEAPEAHQAPPPVSF